MREANFGSYSVITDASDKEVAAWVAQFDDFRRVVQEMMEIRDEQLLHLTVILFKDPKDLAELFYPLQVGFQEVPYRTAGFGRQPMIATAVGRWNGANEVDIRGRIVTWLLSSGGLNYDPWIMWGCVDFLSNVQIKQGVVTSTRLIGTIMDRLNESAGRRPPRTLQLDRAPPESAYAWAALHYLLIGRQGWKGMGPVNEYQQLVSSGHDREDAFEQAFGITTLEAGEQINAYIRLKPISDVRLTTRRVPTPVTVDLQPVADGVIDCLVPRLMSHQSGALNERIRERIRRAEALLPDDVRVHETWCFHYAQAQELGMVREHLYRAVRAGTRNHVLLNDWCIELLNTRILTGQGFVCDSSLAREAADILTDLIASHPHRISTYKLLAIFLASIEPVRGQDRKLLEQAREKMPGNPQINVGLAAWHWRNGDLDAARQVLASNNRLIGTEAPIAKAYGEWLVMQIEATAMLEAAESGIALGDFDLAERHFQTFAPRPLGNAVLQKRYQAVNVEISQYHLLQRYEKAWRARELDGPDFLMMAQTVVDNASSPALRTMAEALCKEAGSPAAGTPQ